jgi:hypothetical protein
METGKARGFGERPANRCPWPCGQWSPQLECPKCCHLEARARRIVLKREQLPSTRRRCRACRPGPNCVRGLHCHVPVPHAGQERSTLLRFELLGESIGAPRLVEDCSRRTLDTVSWAFVAEIPVATETGGLLAVEKAEVRVAGFADDVVAFVH